jgi:RimJ/RimL family protein N-acetyltransferase
MEPVTLTTERLLLRPFGPADTEAVYRACQDPEIPRWTPVPSPYTIDDAKTFVGTTVPKGWADDIQYNFGLFTRDGGDLVGSMGLVRLQSLRLPERQAELGYWTAAPQRRRGYTAEAAREVCRWAFTELGVERLEWLADAGNFGSRAVALKAGFVMEGTLRSRFAHRGTRRDAWIGSLLPSDLGLTSPTPYLPYGGTAGAEGTPGAAGTAGM